MVQGRQLRAVVEIARRALAEQMQQRVAIFPDAQNRMLGCEELFRGTLTETSVYPREVGKTALRYDATGAIFAHNHPSDVAEPSRAEEFC